MYLGLKAMFIDLYNPGSLEARELNNMVNRFFWVSMIFAVPLLYEKVKRFNKWYDSFITLPTYSQQKTIFNLLKPVLVQIIVVLILAVVVAIIISMYFNIPPEVIQNYQDYYYKDSFNYYNLNNISNESVDISMTDYNR